MTTKEQTKIKGIKVYISYFTTNAVGSLFRDYEIDDHVCSDPLSLLYNMDDMYRAISCKKNKKQIIYVHKLIEYTILYLHFTMNNKMHLYIFKKIIWKCWSVYKNSLDGLKKLSKLCCDIQTAYKLNLYSYGEIDFDVYDLHDDMRKKDLLRTIVYVFFESNDLDLLNIFLTNLTNINKKYPRHIDYRFSITIPNPSEGFESVINKISNNYDYFLSFNISCFDYFTAFIELDIDYRIYLLKQIKDMEIIMEKDRYDTERLPFSPVLNIVEYNNNKLFDYFEYNFYDSSFEKSIFHILFVQSSIHNIKYINSNRTSIVEYRSLLSYEEHSYLLKIILRKPIDSLYFQYLYNLNFIGFLILNKFSIPYDILKNIIDYYI
jgi:hypothetical protein